MLAVEDFSDAIIGTCYDHAVGEYRLVYDVEKCIQILIKDDGWTREEAINWMDYNVLHAFIGKDQPIFVERQSEIELGSEAN